MLHCGAALQLVVLPVNEGLVTGTVCWKWQTAVPSGFEAEHVALWHNCAAFLVLKALCSLDAEWGACSFQDTGVNMTADGWRVCPAAMPSCLVNAVDDSIRTAWWRMV